MARGDRKTLDNTSDLLAEIKKRITADESILTDADKTAAFKAAEEHLTALKKEKALGDFTRRAILELEREQEPAQAYRSVTINLPGHSHRIALDGICYYHGWAYPVIAAVEATLLDIMARAWEHEDEIGGANNDAYKRRPAGVTLRPGMEGSSAGAINRSALVRV